MTDPLATPMKAPAEQWDGTHPHVCPTCGAAATALIVEESMTVGIDRYRVQPCLHDVDVRAVNGEPYPWPSGSGLIVSSKGPVTIERKA